MATGKPIRIALRAVAGALCFIAILAGLRAICVAWAGARLAGRAEALLRDREAGVTPFRWEMEWPGEISRSSSAGISPPTWDDGTVHFRTLTEDPYLFLTLGGIRIPARKYPRLSFRARANRSVRFRVYFWETGSSDPMVSPSITVGEGWSEYRLDLGSVVFSSDKTGLRGLWGGELGEISTLRIDPGMQEGVDVEIDWIRLEPRSRFGLTLSNSSKAPLRAHNTFTVLNPRHCRDRAEARSLVEKAFRRGRPIVLRLGERHREARDVIGILAAAAAWAEFDLFWLRPEEMCATHREVQVLLGGVPLFPFPKDPADVFEALQEEGDPFLPFGQNGGGGENGRFAVSLCLSVLLVVVGISAFIIPVRAKRALAAVEFAVLCGVGLYLLAAFEAFSGSSAAVVLLTVFVIFGGVSVARDLARSPSPWAELGLGRQGFRLGALSATAVTVLGLGGLVLAAALTGSLRFKGLAPVHFGGYIFKGMAQQVLLCLFLYRRAAEVRGGQGAFPALGAATVFALLHMPNLTFAAGVLSLGWAWAYIYGQTRALLPLAVSHAVMGTGLVTLVSGPLVHSQRVGARFFG